MAGKMMMVFDCQEMPKDVKKYFFDHYGEGASNDCYVDVYIEGGCNIESDNRDCDYDCDKCDARKYDIVEQWLRENGVIGDEAIVKRWW